MTSNELNIRTIRDQILVHPDAAETQTSSGLIIPGVAQGAAASGVVAATGSGHVTPGGVTLPLEVEEGDSIMFREGAGTEIKHNGTKFLIMRESDVLIAMIK